MPKAGSVNSYQSRLNRVVDHLYANLESDLNHEDLAEIACLSPYHWHRIYKAMQGETVSATLKRLRLDRAADRLANSDLAIGEVAQRAGYSTVESFGRAFKGVYGQAPADYRKHGSHAAYKAARAEQDTGRFEVVIEDLPPVRCASVAHIGSFMKIDQAMAKLFGTLAERELLPDNPRMMAQFFGDPDAIDEESLRSAACVPVKEPVVLEPPLQDTLVRGGPYARLRYRGPYADMKDAYQWLYGTWLPTSGREAAHAPTVEMYLNSPQDVIPTDLLTDICLPLETQP
ncbi:MAG: AraC family transcriptional regulator [Alphaproteobacteria bacterium]|nr:AraC family transcriptional regulator [Alphaproteobacteria bacterium]